jgi:DNA-binding XRE family transcriptional regulator
MKNWKAIRKIFIEAGINTTEASKLLDVSRQTLYNWNKTFAPDAELKDKINILLRRIEKARKQGDLPLLSVNHAERLETLFFILIN